MLYNSIEETIGNTPLIKLGRIQALLGLESEIFAKIEFFNPGGSIKDRPALKMLADALAQGKIREGSTIIEPTSGNTGIGLAVSSARYGLKVILVMPESVSKERIMLLKAYGADIILTPAENGMGGAIEKAAVLARDIPGSFMPMQFENPSNPAAHFQETAVEIYKDMQGKVDYFAAGVGTGGTITGCGGYLKLKNPLTRVIAVEPGESAVLSGERPSRHGIQGIGAGFVPRILDTSIIDEIIKVTTAEAIEYTMMLAKTEKILAGISSGANLFAAVQIARRQKGKRIVTIIPDTGERYLSTGLFEGLS
ncbi:MAG: cysteine synthase A [Clostridia bacterium]|nr:cysteine synthase A [Clostridia bacterium]